MTDGESKEGSPSELTVDQKVQRLTDVEKASRDLPGLSFEYTVAFSSTPWGFDRPLSQVFNDPTSFPNDLELMRAVLGDKKGILEMTGRERLDEARREEERDPTDGLQVLDYGRNGYDLLVPTVIENLQFQVKARSSALDSQGTFASIVRIPAPITS